MRGFESVEKNASPNERKQAGREERKEKEAELTEQIRKDIMGEEYYAMRGHDPKWEAERQERQEKTIATIASFAEEQGVSENIFLLGGYASGVERLHADVDFVVQGEEPFQRLREEINQSGLFSEQVDTAIEDSSKKDFSPTKNSEMAHVDIRLVDREERNGVVVWKMRLPQILEDIIGKDGLATFEDKPPAIPDSAFDYGKTADFKGHQIRLICPEYIFLSKGDSPNAKDRFDKLHLKKRLNQERLRKIVEDARQANIILNVSQSLTKKLNNRFIESDGRGGV